MILVSQRIACRKDEKEENARKANVEHDRAHRALAAPILTVMRIRLICSRHQNSHFLRLFRGVPEKPVAVPAEIFADDGIFPTGSWL